MRSRLLPFGALMVTALSQVAGLGALTYAILFDTRTPSPLDRMTGLLGMHR